MALTIINPAMLPYVSAFLLVFATVLALLAYSRIFVHRDREGNPTEKSPTKIYAMIAIVFAAFSAMYEPLVSGLSQYMPIAAGLLVVIFFIALIKRVFERKKKDGQNSGTTFPLVLSLGILLLILAVFSDSLTRYAPAGYDPNSILWVIGLIIVLAIFWGAYKYTGTATSAPAEPPRR